MKKNNIKISNQHHFSLIHAKEIVEFEGSVNFKNYINSLDKNLPIFISCTNLPTKGVIQHNIFSSNSVMFDEMSKIIDEEYHNV